MYHPSTFIDERGGETMRKDGCCGDDCCRDDCC
jgi:hypothetical protein